MASTLAERPAAPPAVARAGKYLAFELGQEAYAIRVLKVREIIGVRRSRTCRGRPIMSGVFSTSAEKVIPVIDLQCKFGRPPTEYGVRTSIRPLAKFQTMC